MNPFDKLASILSRRKNSASHEQIGITIEHARELIQSYEDLLAQRNAGEFDLFDAIPLTEAKSDIRHAFARQVSGAAKKPQEFWGR